MYEILFPSKIIQNHLKSFKIIQNRQMSKPLDYISSMSIRGGISMTSIMESTNRSIATGNWVLNQLLSDGIPVVKYNNGVSRLQIGENCISIACPSDIGGCCVETLPINKNDEFFSDDYMIRHDSYENLLVYLRKSLVLNRALTYDEYEQVLNQEQ